MTRDLYVANLETSLTAALADMAAAEANVQAAAIYIAALEAEIRVGREIIRETWVAKTNRHRPWLFAVEATREASAQYRKATETNA